YHTPRFSCFLQPAHLAPSTLSLHDALPIFPSSVFKLNATLAPSTRLTTHAKPPAIANRSPTPVKTIVSVSGDTNTLLLSGRTPVLAIENISDTGRRDRATASRMGISRAAGDSCGSCRTSTVRCAGRNRRTNALYCYR